MRGSPVVRNHTCRGFAPSPTRGTCPPGPPTRRGKGDCELELSLKIEASWRCKQTPKGGATMRDPKILEDTVAAFTQAVTTLIESSEAAKEPTTFGLMEGAIFKALMAIGALLLARLCGAQTGYQGKSVVGHRDVGRGKHRLKYKGKKRRWVVTIFGKIFFWRAYYRNTKFKDSRWPRDEQLGLLPEEILSPGVLEKVTLLSTVTGSYDQAAQTLKEFLPVDLQYKQAQRECVKLGAEMERIEAEEIERVFEQRQRPEDPKTPPPEALLVGCDGITTPHCAGEDMEIKVGRVDRAALQPPPKKTDRTRTVKRRRQKKKTKEDPSKQASRKEQLADLKESREHREYNQASDLVKEVLHQVAPGREKALMYRKTTETSTYRATARLGVEDFGRQLWLAAQKAGVELAALVLFLADGGKWCWEVCKTHFPTAVQILDVFHVARHLVEASNLLWGTRSEEARRWRKHLLEQILRGHLDAVIEELEGLLFTEESKRKARKELLTYLRNNRERMDYPRYIQEGYPISSAMDESACRHVIGTRMKGSGRRWDDDGADAMARLRAVHCSGKWGALHQERQQRRLQNLRELRTEA